MNNITTIQDEINQLVQFQPQEIYSKDEIVIGSALVQFNTLCDNLTIAGDDLEKIKQVYQEYYNKTKGTSSFLTVDPNSKISEAIFKITAEIADRFKISPLALLLPANTKIHFFAEDINNIEKKEGWDTYVENFHEKDSVKALNACYQRWFYGVDNVVESNQIGLPVKDIKKVRELNHSDNGKLFEINPEFFERILNSNSLIREAFNLEKEIKEVEESGYSLKAELIKLANALFDNGVNGRFGSEGYAGPGASIAIGEFRGKWNAYYKDEFVKLAGKLEQNSDTRNKMEKLVTQIHQLDDGSCVDIKSKALKAAINELESILDKNFIEEKDSNKHKEILTKLNNRYKVITAEIGNLKNEGKIKTIDSLPLDLACFLQNNKLSMRSVYNNAESINIFDLETILQQVSDISVDEMNEEDIYNNILLYPKHFLAMWNRLSEESKQEIQNHIKEDEYIYKGIANQINDPHITDDLKERLLTITINVLTKDGDSFCKIYRNLDGSNKNNYFEAVKNNFPFITHTGDDFEKIYDLLNTFVSKSERDSYFEAVKTKLLSITHTGDDFEKIYELLDTFVSKSERDSYFEAIQTKLPSITKTAFEFYHVYKILNVGDRNNYVNAMKDKLPSLTHTVFEFYHVYEILDVGDRNNYVNAMQDKLPSLTNTITDFSLLYKILDIQNKNNYVNAIKNKLPFITDTISGFSSVYETLDVGDRNNYVDAIKDKLPSLTHIAFEFCCVYETLDVKDRKNYVDAIKDKLPSLTHTKDEFYTIYCTLEAGYRKEYFQTLTSLKDKDWFGNVLKDINLLNKKTSLLEALCQKSSQNVRKIFGYGGTNITFNGQIYNVTNEVAETLTQKFLSLVSNKDISYEKFHSFLIEGLKKYASEQSILKSYILRSTDDRMLYQALESDKNQHNQMSSYLGVNN